MASTAALTQYGLVYGGGTGSAPGVTGAGTTARFCMAIRWPPSWSALVAGDLPANVTYNDTASAFSAVKTFSATPISRM